MSYHRSEPTQNDSTDRLALSRARHFQTRNQRNESVSEKDDGLSLISDWSESDRECCPLSDFELASNVDDSHVQNRQWHNENEIVERLPPSSVLIENGSQIDQRTSITGQLSSMSEQEKNRGLPLSNLNKSKSFTSTRKLPAATPLLPARRLNTKSVSLTRSTQNPSVLPSSRKLLSNNSPTRVYLSRENTSTSTILSVSQRKDSSVSVNSSSPSNDDVHARNMSMGASFPVASPNLSQTSPSPNLVPRVYEVKKVFPDACDFGRLTDVSAIKPSPARNRQKWGTIVHPPFPLGYQQVSPEKVTHVVERLTSPSRMRDRRTPVQTPSKRYLSIEETEALISRLTKVKTIRSPDAYFPVQGASQSGKKFNNSLKTNQNWKTVGLSA